MKEELASLAAREREVGDGLMFHLTSRILQDKVSKKRQKTNKSKKKERVNLLF